MQPGRRVGWQEYDRSEMAEGRTLGGQWLARAAALAFGRDREWLLAIRMSAAFLNIMQ
jgi:hypothetical protein